MSKYHTSKSGFLAVCTATKRNCLRGHFTQEEYDTLVENNDVRIKKQTTKGGYYDRAMKAYAATKKQRAAVNKVAREMDALRKKLSKKAGLENLTLAQYNNVHYSAKRDVLDYAAEVYESEGVHPSKVKFIIEDMSAKSDPTKPIIKRKDRYDEELSGKTKAAAERLNSDPSYQSLVGKYFKANADKYQAGMIDAQIRDFQVKTSREAGLPMYNAYLDTTTEEKNLKEAQAWQAAGVAPTATKRGITSVKPEDVSLDSTGKINNMWVETSDGVERIVSYSDNGKNSAFLTDGGKKISHDTHYHSYTSTDSGYSTVIVSKARGKSHPAEKFQVHTEWDSGD